MDEIKERLSESSSACLKAYEAWRKNSSDETREALQECIHELRKISSRLEIEIAMNERDRMASKPIPIPPHRASKQVRSSKNNNERGHPSREEGSSSKTVLETAENMPEKKTVRRGRKPKTSSAE